MRARGFTLIELLVVVAVISVLALATIAIPSLIEARIAADAASAQRGQTGALPPRMRLDYEDWNMAVLCDTVTGTLVYRATAGGVAAVAAVPGGCK